MNIGRLTITRSQQTREAPRIDRCLVTRHYLNRNGEAVAIRSGQGWSFRVFGSLALTVARVDAPYIGMWCSHVVAAQEEQVEPEGSN